jgi:hypothetical protein
MGRMRASRRGFAEMLNYQAFRTLPVKISLPDKDNPPFDAAYTETLFLVRLVSQKSLVKK